MVEHKIKKKQFQLFFFGTEIWLYLYYIILFVVRVIIQSFRYCYHFSFFNAVDSLLYSINQPPTLSVDHLHINSNSVTTMSDNDVGIE